MSAVTAPNAPLRYRGFNSQYVDIAVRGADEYLGLAIEYAIHPSGVGCFIFRFIAHGKGVDPKNFKHLTYRESAKFLVAATETTPAEVIKGLRLTKVAIPVFKPAVHRHELQTFGVTFAIWVKVAAWVTEQVIAEGFSITVPDLQDEVRKLVVLSDTAPGSVECIIEFPNLDAPEQQAVQLKLVQKPEPEEDEDEDGGDDYNGKKDWLN